MTKKTKGFVTGVVLVVGGGFLTKFVDAAAGMALVGAGGFLIGAIQKQWFAPAPTLGKVPEDANEPVDRKGA